jgi:hypothetical protein
MPNEELSYVIVTPYSMRKSRTGGIIARPQEYERRVVRFFNRALLRPYP